MSNDNVLQFAQPEGFTGIKKEFVQDPWQDLYAARQNRTVLQGIPTQIEEHTLSEKKILTVVIMMHGVKLLLPFSETCLKDTKLNENRNRLRKLIGRNIAYVVIGIDRENNLAIISRKAAKDKMAKTFWKNAKLNKIIPAVAQEVHYNNVLVDLGGVEVMIPAPEISHGWVHDARQIIEVGDAFDVKITYVNKEENDIQVSIKELLPSPYPDCLKRYNKGNEYLGTVSGIAEFGIFINLEPGVDAIIPHLSKRKVKLGDNILIKIREIKANEKKIYGTGIRVI
ncbi:S1 RNA-binding domain-containing protein [Chengkuizengella sediminis]|uniref:S1 RNA-binding domain-containing protein n=1 Tax=Chengkuizengella sediminis TaxID=1885917 RepID=UPI001389BE56|nr:S1 RNA-binding domain-containing protein [Chengkuizengella sediminis]NDI36621.1 S1 RNA-binding domain-containing protein [Chengkuizengella sediminis]